MALLKNKINQETDVVNIDGAEFTIRRLNAELRRKIDYVTKKEKNDDKRNQKLAEIIFKDVVVSTKGVTEAWMAEHFVSNSTHLGSKKFEDEDGDSYTVVRGTAEELRNFALAETYQEKASIAVDMWLEDWDQGMEAGGERVALDTRMRLQIINDENWEPLVDEIFSYAVAHALFVKEGLDTEKEVSIEPSRHLKDAEIALGATNVIETLVKGSSNARNFIKELREEEIDQAKN